MKSVRQEHIEITARVKEIISPMGIVFPASYGRIYAQIASEESVELTPEEMVTREMLDEKMVRHVITLADSTDKAISAIEMQDKTALKAILDQTRQLQAEIQELKKVVYEDGLTHCYNRKWFDDTLLENTRSRLKESGSIAMVDLNKFKEINDTYGHVVGDKVLIHIAQKLKESGGRVVRYGGDEFVVVFDVAVPLKEIDSKIESISGYFGRINFKTDAYSFKIGFAYGIVSYSGGTRIDEVLEKADKAMYRHKMEGKTV